MCFRAVRRRRRPPAETKVCLVQRSCGYAVERPTLRIADIQRAVAAIKAQNPEVIVLVDNCYGEFTDVAEPPSVSAEEQGGHRRAGGAGGGGVGMGGGSMCVVVCVWGGGCGQGKDGE